MRTAVEILREFLAKSEATMAKVFGLHVVELNAGTTPEFFERFVIKQFLPALPLDRTPGVKAYLLKADRERE